MSAKKAFSELQARRHPASVFWNFLNLKWFGLEERKGELLMRESALFVAAALAVFHPAVAKVVHRRQVTRERRACTRAGRMATATVPNCQMMIVMELTRCR
jgi:hypothetical protein